VARDGGAPDRQFVAALARGLDILGCFSDAHPSLTVTEIANLLGIPQPSVWRLCHTMIKLGYLTSDSDDRLRPALAVLRLGYMVLSELQTAELAKPYLQALADRFSAASGIAVCEDKGMRLILRFEGSSELVLNLQTGSRVPLATSALGWGYLVELSPQEREAALGDDEVARRTWKANERAFLQACEGYREHGFIVNAGVFHPGYNTVAVPVRGADGRTAFVLNCGGESSLLPMSVLEGEVGPSLRELGRMLEDVVERAP
jgi:DNA-binding IclR family transcriptional regulator